MLAAAVFSWGATAGTAEPVSTTDAVRDSDSTTTVVLGADPWPPYNDVPGRDPPGYVVELAVEAFALAGMTIDYRAAPWARVLHQVSDGDWDGAIGATAEDGKGLVLPEEPVGRTGLMFVVRHNDPWRFAVPADLDRRRVGLVAGYSYPDWLRQRIAASRDQRLFQSVHGDEPLQRNLEKLLAGRLDCVADNEAVLRWQVALNGYGEQITFAGDDPGSLKDLHIAFAPTRRGRMLAAHLDQGIRTLRRTGRLGQILARYHMVDWKPAVAEQAPEPVPHSGSGAGAPFTRP